jgi:hypothetical protein
MNAGPRSAAAIQDRIGKPPDRLGQALGILK